MNANSGTYAYQDINRFSAVEGATPHQLVGMLMQGAIDNIAKAKGFMERRDFYRKGENLSKTVAIISELKSSLDMEKGGEISENLDNLYDYIIRQVLNASMENDPGKLDEAANLISGLLESWNAIDSRLAESE